MLKLVGRFCEQKSESLHGRGRDRRGLSGLDGEYAAREGGRRLTIITVSVYNKAGRYNDCSSVCRL
jgi:hypothetical protein